MDPGLIISFAILGAGIKAVDRAYDDGDFNRRWALALAPWLALLWAYLSLGHPAAATLLGAVFLSSLITGKIDNPAFKLSSLIVAGFFLVMGFGMLVLPLFFLTFLGSVDELAKGYASRVRSEGWRGFVLEHRFGMKVGVALLYAASLMDATYVLAFYSFDLAYETAGAWRASPCRVPLTLGWEERL